MSLPSISPRVGGLDPILTKDSIERSLAEFKLKKNLRAQGLFVNDSLADLTLGGEPDSLRRYAEDSLPALTERKPSYKSGGDKVYQAARALTKTLSDYTAEQSILEEKTRALESHIRDVQQFLVGNDQDFDKNLTERIEASDRKLMSDDMIIERYFKENLKTSLYICKYMKRKDVWNPKPFRLTGRVQVAETFEDLYRFC